MQNHPWVHLGWEIGVDHEHLVDHILLFQGLSQVAGKEGPRQSGFLERDLIEVSSIGLQLKGKGLW